MTCMCDSGGMGSTVQGFDVVVLGGGAAGLMCAMEAGKRGRRVALLEHAERVGKKILISGGGRCNFTNIHCKPENFLSSNPHFAKSALARYRPADFISLVEKHKIPYHEKTLGQLFCDRSARDIVAMLEKECSDAGVRILTRIRVESVQRVPSVPSIERIEHIDQWIISALDGDGAPVEFRSASFVIATGGLSIPKMGATGFGFDLAAQFGIAVRPCRPGLVPLLFGETDKENWCDLAGVSAEVVASRGDAAIAKGNQPAESLAPKSMAPKFPAPSFREKMLITHRGLSGPAVLQISSYLGEGEPLVMDLAPGKDVTESLRHPKARRDEATYRTAFRQVFTQRFSDRWLQVYGPEDWSTRSLLRMEEQLHRWEVQPAGTEGYEKAEVTVGGVDTDELSAKTMESRKVPGLYFIGEVVDVTGWLGGFNFQWAWASGFAAGQAV